MPHLAAPQLLSILLFPTITVIVSVTIYFETLFSFVLRSVLFGLVCSHRFPFDSASEFVLIIRMLFK